MPLRIGLIGAGYWGAKLLRVFSSLPDVTLHRVADPDPGRLSALPDGAHATTDSSAVLASADIDAILIATPPATHAPLAHAALRAGKHCWVEKPLALTVAEARDLVRLAARQQRTLFVDETFLYDPLVRRARQWIADGRLGRLYHLSFERLGLGRVRRDSDIWWNSAPHDVSILRFLTNAEVEDLCVDRFAYLQPDVADVCVATARLSGGASVHFYLSWLSPVRCARAIAVGSGGMLCYEGRFDQRALTYYEYQVDDPAAAHGNVIPIAGFAPTETVRDDAEPLTLAAEAFLDCIRNGAPAPSEGAQSLKVVEILAAAETR